MQCRKMNTLVILCFYLACLGTAEFAWIKPLFILCAAIPGENKAGVFEKC